MSNQYKLIWEYRGPDAQMIAEHYEHHLEDFIKMRNLKSNQIGVEAYSEFYVTAFMIVREDELDVVRQALRPNKIKQLEED
ncbi:MAG TPA: hypothetical protein PK110_08370 [Niabella sp.]|jgi:hypothetical protein|nr:hypothetical protein [Chitinophagaceae bacterium]HRO84819.1 hypothetical protein [Niabella sp.]HUN02462.1 hypothetical protein [Niabella sp.]